MYNDKINNEARAGQIHKFEGMNLKRKIVPTDIDMFVDFGGRLFIVGEGKYMDAEMTNAQKQAFEALCDTYYTPENESRYHAMWVLLYRHEVHDTSEPVYVKDCYVTNTFNSIDLFWRKPDDIEVIPRFKLVEGKITVPEAISQINDWCTENCKFNI